MKLFQQMLVAGASISLLAPIAAQASEVVNLEEMNSYSSSKKSSARLDSKTFINDVSEDIANLKGRLDGLEARTNEYEAGGFSDTTTLDGKAVFAIGTVDNGANTGTNHQERITANYVYQMNLNTSFTGDDNLYVRLKAGDGWNASFTSKPDTYHIEAKDTGDSFNVDKIWYTFPVTDKVTATIGPKIENYYMLAATPSVYKPGALKAFKLGGHGAAFGASTSTGVGLKYVADNGFAASVTGNSKGATDASKGFFSAEDQNKVNAQLAYTDDNYHLSATFSTQRGWNSWSYFSTYEVSNGASSTSVKSDSVALRGWWRPEETGTAVPSISVGYDTMSFTGHTITEASGFTVGLNWADMFQADDKIGIAVGQPIDATEAAAGTTLANIDPFLWEVYYSFRPNDSIEVTPAIFGGTDTYKTTYNDVFGAVLTTTFKF
tara:strand:+ start:915 stop:2219 length:1305 start_codon:yes stop_codon:yes gene_type:complete